MQSERDAYVLVPNAARSAVLVHEGRLPCLRGRPGAAGVIEALRSEYSLAVPYLRPARILRGDEEGKGAGSALYEFDAPGDEWEVPAGLGWLALADVDPARLSPSGLEPYVEKWLAIARGAPLPEARPPWARRSYRRINEALEPDDRWWFADEPGRWLAGAIKLLEMP